MGMRELLACAIALGAAGGYAWTALPGLLADAPVQAPPPPSIDLREVPPTEDDAAADSAWSAGHPSAAEPAKSANEEASAPPLGQTVFYSGCNDVRAAGKAPIYAGQPGYRIEMDGDGDGVACEPYRG